MADDALHRPPVRRVRCPRCGGPAVYAASNPWRPFCSERCKTVDLGAWATEAYRVIGPPAEDPDDPAPRPIDRP